MTTLDPADHYAVFIDTFTVEPEGAGALAEALTRATEEALEPKGTA